MADLPEGGSPSDMEAVPTCTSASPPPPPVTLASSPDTSLGHSDLDLLHKLKESNLEKLHTLCKMHLSFLLDLPGSSLEQFLGGDEGGAATTGSGGALGNLLGNTGGGERHRWFSSKRKKGNTRLLTVYCVAQVLKRVFGLVAQGRKKFHPDQ